MGKDRKRYERIGKDGKAPLLSVVPLHYVKASESRDVTFDPYRRHLRGVPPSSTTRSDDTFGG